MNFEWQQNFRRIPAHITPKLQLIASDEIVVSCTKTIPLSDIQKGKYAHIGIRYKNENVIYEENFFPYAKVGKYSERNRYGYSVVRKDIPKIWKTFYWKVPNCGENYEGPFEIGVDRLVYQRDFIAPGELELSIDLMGQESSKGEMMYHFTFQVEEVLNKNDDAFKESLLNNLNLLMENVGVADIRESNIHITEYLTTTHQLGNATCGRY